MSAGARIGARGASNPTFLVGRGLARLWGLFPSEKLKIGVISVLGPRFLVGVLALIFDSSGRVLLLRHTHDRAHPWGLPSGRLEQTETPPQALVRELAEETGLTVQVGGLVALEREPTLPVVRGAYLCRVVSGVFSPSIEVAEARYFALDDLPPSVRPIQRKLIRQGRASIGDRLGELRTLGSAYAGADAEHREDRRAREHR